MNFVSHTRAYTDGGFFSEWDALGGLTTTLTRSTNLITFLGGRHKLTGHPLGLRWVGAILLFGRLALEMDYRIVFLHGEEEGRRRTNVVQRFGPVNIKCVFLLANDNW